MMGQHIDGDVCGDCDAELGELDDDVLDGMRVCPDCYAANVLIRAGAELEGDVSDDDGAYDALDQWMRREGASGR